jgi:hypothetical protein
MSRQIWNNNDKNVIKDKIFSPLYGVRLLDGLFKDTFENNLGYLKSLDMDAMLYWFRVRAGKNAPGMPYRGHFEDNIKGQTAGLFLMGAGHALRWHEDEEVRGRLNQIVAEIGDCAEADGYLMAVPQSEFGTREYPHYVRIWLTYGLTAAALAGHPEAFGLLRRWQDWFNHCDDLPVIRYLVLAFQGVVASTYLYNPRSAHGRTSRRRSATTRKTGGWPSLSTRSATRCTSATSPARSRIPTEPRLRRWKATSTCTGRPVSTITCGRSRTSTTCTGRTGSTRAAGSPCARRRFPIRSATGYPTSATTTSCAAPRSGCCLTSASTGSNRDRSLCRRVEASINNIGIANQNGDKNIFYFAHLDQEKKNYKSLVHCCCGVGTKLFGALPEYIYSLSQNALYVDLFAASELSWERDAGPVHVRMETDMPMGRMCRCPLAANRSPSRSRSGFRAGRMMPLPSKSTARRQAAATGYVSYLGADLAKRRRGQLRTAVCLETDALCRGRASGRLRALCVRGRPDPDGVPRPSGRGQALAPDRKPEDVPHRLMPTGQKRHYRLPDMPSVELVPYFEIEPGEPFTCFPLFAAGDEA